MKALVFDEPRRAAVRVVGVNYVVRSASIILAGSGVVIAD